MYRVLLISFVNWDSLIELPVLIKNGGCTLDIFCYKGSWALQNKFHDQWIEANEDPAVFLEELLEFIDKNGTGYDWIIPGDDIIIRLLNDEIKDEALFYKIMPLTKIENREILGSKAGFSSLCTKYDIKTPRYLIYREGQSIDEIEAYMRYPFLMKLDKSEGGYGVFRCNDRASFTTHFNNAANKTNMVFQQFIQGYDINVEVLYKNGELMVYNYSRTLKIMGSFGVSTQRLFYANTEIEPELQKIGRSLGVNGFGNVVFMYSEPEKTHYLIEVDIRPNAWMYYGKFTGNDFSEAIKKIIRNDLTLVKPPAKYAGKEFKITLYKKDVYRCIIEKDIKGLVNWARNKENRWRYIPLYDGKLFAACTRYLWVSFRELLAARLKRKRIA